MNEKIILRLWKAQQEYAKISWYFAEAGEGRMWGEVEVGEHPNKFTLIRDELTSAKADYDKAALAEQDLIELGYAPFPVCPLCGKPTIKEFRHTVCPDCISPTIENHYKSNLPNPVTAFGGWEIVRSGRSKVIFYKIELETS